MNLEISAIHPSFPQTWESRAAGSQRRPPVQARGKLWSPAFKAVRKLIDAAKDGPRRGRACFETRPQFKPGAGSSGAPQYEGCPRWHLGTFLILRRPPTGPRVARPEDRLRGRLEGRTTLIQTPVDFLIAAKAGTQGFQSLAAGSRLARGRRIGRSAGADSRPPPSRGQAPWG
jgi:hypothetical protein